MASRREKETSERLEVGFDNTPLQPIVLADHDGVPRTFEIRSMLVATGHAMQAIEVPTRERRGYRFEILGDFDVDAWELFQRLYQKMRREMAIRHIEHTEYGWQIIDGERLVRQERSRGLQPDGGRSPRGDHSLRDPCCPDRRWRWEGFEG